MQVAGAVLAGGASSRMGSNKLLIEVDGRPIGRRVGDALAAGGCDPVVLIGGSPTELRPLGLPLVADLHPGEGPLGGIVTALSAAAAPPSCSHVLVAAGDLALLDVATVVSVLAAVEREPSAAVVVAYTDRIEPGLTVWNRSLASDLDGAFAGGLRAVHRALERFEVVTVSVDPAVLHNVNRPADVPETRRPGQ